MWSKIRCQSVLWPLKLLKTYDRTRKLSNNQLSKAKFRGPFWAKNYLILPYLITSFDCMFSGLKKQVLSWTRKISSFFKQPRTGKKCGTEAEIDKYWAGGDAAKVEKYPELCRRVRGGTDRLRVPPTGWNVLMRGHYRPSGNKISS